MRAVACIGCVVVALTTAAAAPASTRPSLHLVKLQPLVVSGGGFVPAQRLRLVASVAGIERDVTVRVSRRGTLTAQFGPLPLGRCAAYVVRAVGPHGAIALLKSPPLPGCMPAGAPA